LGAGFFIKKAGHGICSMAVGIPPGPALPLGAAAAAIALAIIIWLLSRKPKPPEPFALDKEAGALLLFPGNGVEVTLRAFRVMPAKKAWGFDALVKNRGGDLERISIAFNGARATISRLQKGEMAIRPFEIKRGRRKLVKLLFTIAALPREAVFEEIALPMNEILSKLREAGKISLVRDPGEALGRKTGNAAEREAIAREFEEMLAARREQKPKAGEAEAPPQPAIDAAHALRERLAELAEQEKQAQLSYMKREISEAAFSDVLKKIQAERIEARAKLARLESGKKPAA